MFTKEDKERLKAAITGQRQAADDRLKVVADTLRSMGFDAVMVDNYVPPVPNTSEQSVSEQNTSQKSVNEKMDEIYEKTKEALGEGVKVERVTMTKEMFDKLTGRGGR